MKSFLGRSVSVIQLLVAVCSVEVVLAQNLVVNPSFEQTISDCANFGGESFRADLAGTWDNANSNVAGDSCSSPDLFAPCNVVFGLFSVTGMPDNELGWQQARTGQRYVGIITHEPLSNYREYVQGRTSEPLVEGQDYCVSFFVSKGDNVPFATNNMGVFFSSDQYLRNACPGSQNSLIAETPQLNYDCAPITDTSNWFKLQWNYTATGGEQYFVIGNFFNNANTTIVNTGDGSLLNPYAYYYIDDVSIVPAESCCFAEVAQVDSFCVGDAADTLNILQPLISDCINDVTYSWSGPGITDATNGVFDPASAGTGIHQIILTLSCGYTDTVNITVNDCQPLIVCETENGELAVGGGPGPYSWQQQNTFQDCSGCPFGFCSPLCAGVTVTVWETFASGGTIPMPTEWPIRVIGANGSETIISGPEQIVSCSEICQLSVSIVETSNICQGQNTSGQAIALATGQIGSVSYTWSTDPAQEGAFATGLNEGTFVVTAVDFFGCTATDTVTIASYPEVLPFAGNDTVICVGDSITLTATGGISYLWETGDSTASVSVTPEMTTSYWVWVTGEGNCTDSTAVLVMVDERICLGLFPNVISPGTQHEGNLAACEMVHQNSAFHLPCLEYYPGNKVTIFDRWGSKRFEATDYHNNPWDGNGGTQGVYYWLLQLPDNDKIYQGFFHIVR